MIFVGLRLGCFGLLAMIFVGLRVGCFGLLVMFFVVFEGGGSA